MKRLHAYLAVTAAALALSAVQPAATLAAPGEMQVATAKRINPDQMKLKRVDPNIRRITLLCSPKYKPSPGASKVSYKGGSYTCTLVMPIPPGKKCRNGFAPSAIDAKVLGDGRHVRLVYRCQSSPW